MNDSRHPWLILVPTREGLRDLDELTPEEMASVWADIRLASRFLRGHFHPDKLNIASLGNLVPQLHIHVIARFIDDPAWPHPVWGRNPPLPYPPQEAEKLLKSLQDYLRDAIPARHE
ncbi:MAG: HIT domain-containing protein [Magnetococcales bacterium]|nr:HIT domain-containing protein [Magnetococcales bacterium]